VEDIFCSIHMLAAVKIAMTIFPLVRSSHKK
jgi:hypothetical protein